MRYLISASILLISACTHGPYRDENNVTITSDPPGAMITIGGNYVGKTPLTTDMWRINKSTYGAAWYSDIHVEALPSVAGDCRQNQTIFSSASLPTRMHFVMSLCPRFTY